MKPQIWIFAAVWVALLLTAIGGVMDLAETRTLTSSHLRTDGIFLLGVATFSLVALQSKHR